MDLPLYIATDDADRDALAPLIRAFPKAPHLLMSFPHSDEQYHSSRLIALVGPVLDLLSMQPCLHTHFVGQGAVKCDWDGILYMIANRSCS